VTARRGRKPAAGEPYIPLDTPGISAALGCPVTHPGALDRARALLAFQRAVVCHQDAGRGLSRAVQTERRAATRVRQAKRSLLELGGDPKEAESLLKRIGLYKPPVIVKEKKERVTGLLTTVCQDKAVPMPPKCGTCDGQTFYPGMSWTCPACKSHYNVPKE
jgi:hypothetical protein